MFILFAERKLSYNISFLSLHRSQEKHNWIQMNQNLCKSINPHIDLSRLFIIKMHMIFYAETQTKGQYPHNIYKVIFILEKMFKPKTRQCYFSFFSWNILKELNAKAFKFSPFIILLFSLQYQILNIHYFPVLFTDAGNICFEFNLFGIIKKFTFETKTLYMYSYKRCNGILIKIHMIEKS